MATTLTTYNPTNAPADIALRSKTPWELSFPRRRYGALADMLRRAQTEAGYAVALGNRASTIHPATDALMEALREVEPYLGYIDHLVLPAFSNVSGSNCTAMFNVSTRALEMLPGANGGGTLEVDGGGVVLNLGGGQGRGLLCDVNPDLYNATSKKTVIRIGKEVARPAGTGQVVRVVSGSVSMASIGVVPSGTKHRVVATRRLIPSNTLQTTTLDSSADSPLDTYYEASLYLDAEDGTIRLDVDGSTVIAETAWGTGDGIFNNTGYTCQIAIPGASNTQNVRHALYAILNTTDPAIVDPIRAVFRDLCPMLP